MPRNKFYFPCQQSDTRLPVLCSKIYAAFLGHMPRIYLLTFIQIKVTNIYQHINIHNILRNDLEHGEISFEYNKHFHSNEIQYNRINSFFENLKCIKTKFRFIILAIILLHKKVETKVN